MVLESYFDIEANDKLLPSNYLSLYHFCKFFVFHLRCTVLLNKKLLMVQEINIIKKYIHEYNIHFYFFSQ